MLVTVFQSRMNISILFQTKSKIKEFQMTKKECPFLFVMENKTSLILS